MYTSISHSNALNPVQNNCAFRVASYNVLCQNLMASHPDLYRSCDPQYLDWGYRSETFLREIKCFLPDVSQDNV